MPPLKLVSLDTKHLICVFLSNVPIKFEAFFRVCFPHFAVGITLKRRAEKFNRNSMFVSADVSEKERCDAKLDAHLINNKRKMELCETCHKYELIHHSILLLLRLLFLLFSLFLFISHTPPHEWHDMRLLV